MSVIDVLVCGFNAVGHVVYEKRTTITSMAELQALADDAKCEGVVRVLVDMALPRPQQPH